MLAKVHSYQSPDIENIETHRAEGIFHFLISVLIGPRDQEGHESFNVTICSPKWLEENISNFMLHGRHMVITNIFDFGSFKTFFEKTVLNLSADNWDDLAKKISHYARWEFEDYRGQNMNTMEILES